MLKKLSKYTSFNAERSSDSDEHNKVWHISSPLFVRSVLQTARFEGKTTMPADRGSNFAAVGDRNCAENPQKRGMSNSVDQIIFKLYYYQIDVEYELENHIESNQTSLFNVLLNFRQISSEDVVTSYVQRCKEVNPIINAIVENRFEDAIQEAREIDSFLQSTTIDGAKIASEKPLLGLPVTIKESIAVQGKSHISILPHFKCTRLRLF